MAFMWPPMWAQDPHHPKKQHKHHLCLNKLAILCANNFSSKRDASNLKSDLKIWQKVC